MEPACVCSTTVGGVAESCDPLRDGTGCCGVDSQGGAAIDGARANLFWGRDFVVITTGVVGDSGSGVDWNGSAKVCFCGGFLIADEVECSGNDGNDVNSSSSHSSSSEDTYRGFALLKTMNN